ncbi:MAG: Holliday junction branch migration protein RuvA [Dehalococcoidia bacterium]|nr:Holliday junction branch migration protein RuvA [Dehalococcoidia bacterium]
MIAGLDGILEQLNTDSAVIKVGGVSFQVFTPASTISRLGTPGDRVRLHTYLHLKDDSAALYGFTSPQELELFKMLITVSGVGPKSALAVLSSLTPDDLAQAILADDVALITQAPGIGKRTAGRIVLELKGKLERDWGGAISSAPQRDNSQVVAALTGLGYSTADAMRAAAAVPGSDDVSLEEKIRLALRHLARQ